MTTHTTRQHDILSSTEPHTARRRRLIWLLALLAASAAAAVAGVAVAAQLTRSSTIAPAVQHESSGDTPEAPGTTGDQGAPGAGTRAHPLPSPEYVWRPAYVRGKHVLIRVRADAANVREDRGISAVKP